MKTLGLLILLASATAGWSAAAQTVKTNHDDVNIWSAPGRDGSSKVDQIKKYEEVEVTGQPLKLLNGETWFPVTVRRLPGWRESRVSGYVDAKFFDRIDQSDSSGGRTEAETCENGGRCNQTKTGFRLPGARSSPRGYIWPVPGVLRSGFGWRIHPVFGYKKFHNGIDIAGNAGKTVRAAKRGKVITSKSGCRVGHHGCNRGAGNYVEILHDGGLISQYMHLAGNCPLPRAGTPVEQGAPIGCVGKTGVATGYHLHFGIRNSARKYTNPFSVLPSRR